MPFSRRHGLKSAGVLGSLMASASVSRLAGAAQIPIGTPEPEASPNEGGEWVIGISELPDTLDPHKTGAAITSTILSYAGDPLIAKNFDGEYVGGAATNWEISEDGLTWTFQLRDDITFHDGTPLNAEAVKFNFDRILDPATSSITAAAFLGPMESTAALDEYTFEFVLSEPFAPLLEYLTAAVLSIASPAAIESMGEEFGRAPVLSGPWMVDEWRTGDRVVLTRNPDYAWAPEFLHQDGPAYIETLVFQSVIEEASRIAAFEVGEINQTTIPSTDIERITSADNSWIVNYLRQGEVFLEFNVTAEPFTDVAVRRALNHAVDKEAVLAAAVENYGLVAHGFLPPSIFGYWEGIEEYAPAFDPERATAMLAEAGWSPSEDDGVLEKDGSRLEFTALNLPIGSWGRAAQVVQSQLGDIGVSMEIQQLEFATLLEVAKSGEHQAEFMGYFNSDPDIAYLWFHSSQAGEGLNMSHVDGPHLDQLIIRGRTTMDREERAAVYAEMQRYITDIALWVPLWVDEYYTGFNKSIHNAKFHPDNYTVLFDAWVD